MGKQKNNPFNKSTRYENSNGASNYKHNNEFKKKNNFKKNFNKKFQHQRGGGRNMTNFSNVSRQTNLPDATPWTDLKQSLNNSSNNSSNDKKQSNQTTTFDKKRHEEIVKQRNENYRKFLIQESQKEKPKWEQFSNSTIQKNNNKSGNSLNRKKNNLKNDLSSNFDLSNKYRKVITVGTIMSKGCTIENAIQDLKNTIGKKNNLKK